MLRIIFMPKKRAPSSFTPIEYLVEQYNNIIALSLAKLQFIKDGHNTKYYDNVIITEAYILQ